LLLSGPHGPIIENADVRGCTAHRSDTVPKANYVVFFFGEGEPLQIGFRIVGSKYPGEWIGVWHFLHDLSRRASTEADNDNIQHALEIKGKGVGRGRVSVRAAAGLFSAVRIRLCVTGKGTGREGLIAARRVISG
jgi:hypothetical protein